LITVDEQYSNGGMRNSVVDMTLSGGLGDVLAGQQNFLIFSINEDNACIVSNAAATTSVCWRTIYPVIHSMRLPLPLWESTPLELAKH